jgi:hypothetical protein
VYVSEHAVFDGTPPVMDGEGSDDEVKGKDNKADRSTKADKSTSALILVLLTGIQFEIPQKSQTKLD